MDDDQHEILQDCLADMRRVYDKYVKAFIKAGGEEEDFAMYVLEQWRPW